MTTGYKNFKIKFVQKEMNWCQYFIKTPEGLTIDTGYVDMSTVSDREFLRDCRKKVDEFLTPEEVVFVK